MSATNSNAPRAGNARNFGGSGSGARINAGGVTGSNQPTELIGIAVLTAPCGLGYSLQGLLQLGFDFPSFCGFWLEQRAGSCFIRGGSSVSLHCAAHRAFRVSIEMGHLLPD